MNSRDLDFDLELSFLRKPYILYLPAKFYKLDSMETMGNPYYM